MTDAFTADIHPDDFRRDRWGRPMVTHPDDPQRLIAYGRPSSWGKKIEDTFGLEQWQRRMVVVGMARTPALVARAAAIPHDPKAWTKADKDALNAVAADALTAAKSNEAADIGTALHRMTERHDLGEPLDLPEPFAADIAAYAAGMTAYGWRVDPAHVECRMVCDDLQLAGTADRLITLDDRYMVADLKTGTSIEQAALGYAVQLAIYAHSALYDVATGTRTALPLDHQRAVILHLPAGQGCFTAYDVDIDAGWEAAQLAADIDRWRKRRNLLAAIPIPTPGATDTRTRRDRIRDRCRTLATISPAAAAALKANWPAGCPAVDACTDDQLDQVDTALARYEAEVSAPFDPEPQPAPEPEPVLPPAAGLDVDPDQGGTVADVTTLRQQANRLDPAGQAWVRGVCADAQRAGRPITLATPTERNANLIRALILLVEHGYDAELELCVALVARQLNRPIPSGTTFGAALSALNHRQATALVADIAALDGGTLTLGFDADGTMRLHAA